MPYSLRTVIQPDAWRVALEKFGAATGTTVGLYEPLAIPILGPVHPTSLFEAVNAGRDAPAMFTDCVRQSLSREDVPVVIEEHGVAVVGVRLALAGKVVGAVVAGYCLTTFPEEATIRRFIQDHRLSASPVWRTVRRQAPLTRRRLDLYAELLAALTEAMLSENVRTQEHQRTAARLVEAVQAKDQFLAMLAHELRNPLAPIRIAMQIIGMRETSRPEVIV